ncbi:cofactor FMO1 FAD enzyme [Apodospora peruviana]|uniref:Cofactor FMO1 FAD enzyme n=1 Tax=Apodospora peruviana TaxID=516989 RepID=A0AAE0HSA3_9PEZI|nr:cofactor FMO1 FAD enzyme [Apodospora peruviana]KAK3312041.1 cofactor FMO1 FAD enzyme [Apodospora peruviana]
MIDILIVGAGPSGLCAAKTFLQYDGNTELVIIDALSTVGGAWAKEKLYPTLKTNNLFTSVDFTDFPMDQQRFGVGPGEHITGEVMHDYLTAYADHFHLTDRIRFKTRVVDVRRTQDGWAVETENLDTNSRSFLVCRKLVIATGVLSVPSKPDIQGADDFGVPFIHSADLGPQADAVMKNPDIKTVAVLGGCKSAYDAVYLAATTGHKVEWIIRKSGRGPTWVFPTHTMLGPFRAWRERLITRRFFSFMSPCVFPDFSGFGWLRAFLHFNRVGSFVREKFWGAIYVDTLRDCEYRTNETHKVLEPEQSPFWYGTASGTLNYEEDFLSFIRSGQVRIHRNDISHLSSGGKIHLVGETGDTQLDVDALVASTGYSAKPTISFSPAPSLHSDLGVPTTELSTAQGTFWSELDDKADLAIGQKFPQLLLGPPEPSEKPINLGAAREVTYTPWRLYRGIAPPGLTSAGDRSLVFVGMFSNVANTIRLEVQCLWALGYLTSKLPSVDRDVEEGKVFEETALFQRFAQHRAPYGHGRFYPDLVFDQLPYWDTLLSDLGLKTQRKGSKLKELFEPYTQADYRGLVEEWVAKQEGKQ